MDKEQRSRIILAQVLGYDRKWGRDVAATGSSLAPKMRLIEPDHRWQATVTRKHSARPGPADTMARHWDLLSVSAYGELRLAMLFDSDGGPEAGSQINLYYPGPWEAFFCLDNGGDTERVTPGGAIR